MPHAPAMPNEIAQRVLARFAAISGADTANLGGDIATLIGVIAEELSLADRRFGEMVQSYGFTAFGQALVDRCGQLPRNFPSRQAATRAYGGAFSVYRSDTTEEETYAAGTIRASKQGDPSVVYSNDSTIVFGTGEDTVLDAAFVCATPGAIGSAGPGVVNTVVSSTTGNISGLSNTASMTGLDLESLESLKYRAERWLWTLAMAQTDAMEQLALTYVASNGQTVIHAKMWADPDHRGYSELIVSDGTTMAANIEDATSFSGVLPTLAAGSRFFLEFDYPAATAPKLKLDGVTYQPYANAWTALEELGEMWTKLGALPSALVAGAAWEITGHKVYRGWIAEYQRYINRYCVAQGTRVRVRPAEAQTISISAQVVTTSTTGRTRAQVLEMVRTSIKAFIDGIEIGKPLRLFDLIEVLHQVPDVINVKFDHGDFYPGSPKHKLVTTITLIQLR